MIFTWGEPQSERSIGFPDAAFQRNLKDLGLGLGLSRREERVLGTPCYNIYTDDSTEIEDTFAWVWGEDHGKEELEVRGPV